MQAIETLSEPAWYAKLKEEQSKFEQIYKDKIDAESEKNSPQIKAIKKKLSKYLNALLTYVEMKAELNAEKFSPLAGKLDEIITDIVSIAKARQTRKGNASDKANEEAKG